MAHHRGLFITMLVVVVVFIVGTSTMAWATNDTNEPIEDDVAVDGYNTDALSPNGYLWFGTYALTLRNFPRGEVRLDLQSTQDFIRFRCLVVDRPTIPVTSDGSNNPIPASLTFIGGKPDLETCTGIVLQGVEKMGVNFAVATGQKSRVVLKAEGSVEDPIFPRFDWWSFETCQAPITCKRIDTWSYEFTYG
jgi:hypothetical protein